MARIRTIKPEFPQSENMGRVSRDARLLFVLLWTICDDEGRSRGSSRMLASLLFPYDDDAPQRIEGWLRELESECCIARYTSDGCSYVQVCNWLIHQKIDKPSKSRLPAFSESSRTFANPLEHSSVDLGPRTVDQGSKPPHFVRGLSGGEQPEPADSAPAEDPTPASQDARPKDAPSDSGSQKQRTPRGARLPDNWTLPRKYGVWALEEFPSLSEQAIRMEAERFRDYWIAKPGKDGTKTDWEATWRNWIRRVAAPDAQTKPAVFSMYDHIKTVAA